ncbi:hypothetical protein KUCAC02_030133 [Chaenocephalus aceratus]|uniref:Uncharacterized protein n=1 Tax=Chaenocephalus aceratus TaxID=36190 RepID=A0ACB9XIU9_CHAAC|nr:hypothetical protein KUCAC02_030133 [Chaenocephalus aceratus]
MEKQRDPAVHAEGQTLSWTLGLVGKYQQNHEKKREKHREKRRLKAAAQREEYIASKSHGPQQSALDELLDWSVC